MAAARERQQRLQEEASARSAQRQNWGQDAALSQPLPAKAATPTHAAGHSKTLESVLPKAGPASTAGMSASKGGKSMTERLARIEKGKGSSVSSPLMGDQSGGSSAKLVCRRKGG